MSGADCLIAAFRARLGDVVETDYRAELWHSATFGGLRHVFTLEVGPDADIVGFAWAISEDEIHVPDGFVADVVVRRCAFDARRIIVSALTIAA